MTDDFLKSEALKLSFRNRLEPLLVLFNKAAGLVLPDIPFYMAYSIPGGVYGYFKDHLPGEKELNQIRQHIHRLLAEKPDFEILSLSRAEMIRYFAATRRADIIHLLSSGHNPQAREEGYCLARVERYGELLLNDLSPDYEALKKFQLRPYNKGFFLIADPDFFQRVMPEKIEKSKYYRRFEESEENMRHMGISDFAELNDAVDKGNIPEFIKLAEVYQNRRLGQIADNILSHPSKPKVIFLAGPSSSGKTTSANRLAIELKVLRREVLILSLDNYYRPHTEIPDDPVTGMKNFELISALNLELFVKNIHDLLEGKTVFLPRYHFDGKGAIPEATPTRISPGALIIVEGIHGLNPALWQQIMDVESYRLYVSALTTLNVHDHLPCSTSDHRLLRRLVRDHHFRGYDFNETIKRWPDVLENEHRSIFPFQESAHAIFNSALIYEFAVFAHYAPAILKPEKAASESIRQEVLRLKRILSLLNPIDPAGIPPMSVLREFIGGSSFQY